MTGGGTVTRVETWDDPRAGPVADKMFGTITVHLEKLRDRVSAELTAG